jgi:hypothetical protein
MRKAYIIRMSEDGVCPVVYTNVKALFQGIIETGYEVKFIEGYGRKRTPLTYSSLVKNLKGCGSSLGLVKDATSYSYGTLEIILAELCSK